MANQGLIALAEEHARAVENFASAYDQVRALKCKLEDMEEKIEAMPAQTAASIEAKPKCVLQKVRYADDEALVKSVASDAAEMAGRAES